MTRRVLLFARLRELASADAVELPHIEGETLGRLRSRVAAACPALSALLPHCAFALNGDYAPDHQTVSPADEVAAIPPVSGGANEEPYLSSAPIDADALTARVRHDGGGAVVTFLGTVRDLTGDTVTTALEYEAHGPMAERKMQEIERDIEDRWPGVRIAMRHRLGRVEVGEIAVVVAVSAPHRPAAFDACRHAIDRLKELVPIWKRDFAADGSAAWVHPEPGS